MPNHTVTDVIAHTPCVWFGFPSFVLCPSLCAPRLYGCVWCVILFFFSLSFQFFLRARSHVPLIRLIQHVTALSVCFCVCENEPNWVGSERRERAWIVLLWLFRCSLHSLVFAEIVWCVARLLSTAIQALLVSTVNTLDVIAVLMNW